MKINHSSMNPDGEFRNRQIDAGFPAADAGRVMVQFAVSVGRGY
jgi:hypothetical protein